MNLSKDARWLLGFIAGASPAACQKAIEAWIEHDPRGRTAALQELLDADLVKAGEKGRYWLTKDGQAVCSGGAA